MRIIKKVSEMRDLSRKAAKAGKGIGFVPTMGYLHEGHESLIRAARRECDMVVVSIFVNPLQFGPKEDLKKYPRDMVRDKKICEKNNVNVLFTPSAKEMYGEGCSVFVDVENALAGVLCGRSRPGHFRGVATVVTKLFNIVKPDKSYFGQKDAQQAVIIERMVKDLNIDTLVRVMPTVREKDGLAKSSRNVYLSREEREKALGLSQALGRAAGLVKKGERSAQKIKEEMKKVIRTAGRGVRIDYAEVVSVPELKPVKKISGDPLAALAVFVGKTRLIDNLRLKM